MKTSSYLWGNKEPVCPYCDEKYGVDDWDGRGYDGETVDAQCGSCDKHFEIEVIVQVSYSTVGSCEANKEMPHNLVLIHPDVMQYQCNKCSSQFYDWELEGGKHQKITKDQYTVIDSVRHEFDG